MRRCLSNPIRREDARGYVRLSAHAPVPAVESERVAKLLSRTQIVNCQCFVKSDWRLLCETATKSESGKRKAESGKRKAEGHAGQGRDLAAGGDLRVGGNFPQKFAATPDFSKPPVDFSLLTPRQLEILRCFVDTPHEPQIARRLGVRPKTVKVHLLNIQKKLQVTCRVELMKAALHALGGDMRDGLNIGQRLTVETSEND